MFGEIYSVLNPIPYGWDYEFSLGKVVSANSGLYTAVVLKKLLTIPGKLPDQLRCIQGGMAVDLPGKLPKTIEAWASTLRDSNLISVE